MSVIRAHKTSNYTVMSNYHLKDKDISLKAKGLLSVILSLPDDWDYSIAGLVAICKESETSVKTALNELKEYRYVKVTKQMPNETETGRIEYIYDIFEVPIQEHKKQGVENLGLEFLGVENIGQLNTNKSNTKELNTNEYIYNIVEEIVKYLNGRAGTKYNPKTKQTVQHIRARLSEGYTVDDFKTVIDKKCDEWLGTEWEGYLRPNTLFAGKFESYLNAPARKGAKSNGYRLERDYDEGFE